MCLVDRSPPLGEAFAAVLPWMIPPLAASIVAILLVITVPGLYFLYAERADR